MTIPLIAATARTAEHVWSIRESSLQTYLTARAAGTAQRGAKQLSGRSTSSPEIASFRAHGVFVPQAEWSDEVDTTQLTRMLRAAAADDQVAGVLLDIDSPGGSTAGLAELVAAAREVASVKPLYACVSGCCCSAAYRVASQATAIYSGARDDIGSIGTRSLIYDWSAYFQQAGIEAVASDTGPLKSIGVMGLPVTDEQRAFLQSRVDYLQQDFKSDLLLGRGFTDDEYEAVATGGYWFGEQALEMNLIDGLQGMQETMAGLQAAITPRSKGARQMAETTETVEAPKAATSKEIKSQFPNTTAEFREEMTESGATIGEVAIAWAAHCESELASERAAREKAEADAEKANAKKPEATKSKRGVGAVNSVSEAESEDDPVQSWRDLVGEFADKCNGDRAKAFAMARRKNPELARAARAACQTA